MLLGYSKNHLSPAKGLFIGTQAVQIIYPQVIPKSGLITLLAIERLLSNPIQWKLTLAFLVMTSEIALDARWTRERTISDTILGQKN